MLTRTFYKLLERTGENANFLQFSNIATAYQYERVYKALPPLSGKALDWGCGNGHFSRYLVELGIETVGYSLEGRPDIRSNLFSFVHGTHPTQLPFDDCEFDIVFSIGVLEHVWEFGGNDADSVSEIKRVLKPGGTFFCAHLPNKYGWIEPTAKALGLVEHFHKKKYTYKDIQNLLDGFRIQTIGRYNFLPRNQLAKLRPGPVVGSLINIADRMLSSIFPMLNQNYYFIATRRASR